MCILYNASQTTQLTVVVQSTVYIMSLGSFVIPIPFLEIGVLENQTIPLSISSNTGLKVQRLQIYIQSLKQLLNIIY